MLQGNLPSPHSGFAILAAPVDHNIISSFDQIEEARFEVADFKKNLLSLISFFDDLAGNVQALDLTAKLCFNSSEYENRVAAVKSSMKLIESILEGFALGLTKQLNETHT